MKRPRLLVAGIAVVGVAVAAALVGIPSAFAANLLTNPGFESGTLTGWTCSAGSVVTSPVHSGSRALAGAASASDNATCTQKVAVKPSTAYTLSAWVRGSYVFVGVTGGASTWTPSAASYTQLTVAFTTGAGQTSAEVFLHGWYGSGYVRMADVPDAWDVIDLAFGEPTSVTSGDIRFNRCPATECPNVESDTEFIAAIRAKQAKGKKVVISIGGQNGQVQLTSTGARDAFVRSVGAIIDRYGLDGLDIDFEGHSLALNAGDTDFRNPTTPVIVNLISAVRSLKAKYGSKFVLTMAPETFFVQVGYQFYGGAGGGDNRTGAYLPVIHALRGDLTLLHVQDYNSGPVMGLDNQYHFMNGADFHIAMTDMLRAGFRVANTGQTFPGLRPDQIAIGLPAATSAGNGYTPPGQVHQALDCLVKGQNCGGYALRGGTSPGLRGLMTWSINWDRYYNWEFQNSHEPYLNALP